jgi:apolipoprotein D and lipocalin family protein
MHFLPAFCLAITAFFLGACSTRPRASLATVSSVHLDRYAGKWYEIARLPNSFQKDGASAIAQYTLLSSGKVEVLNTETRSNGTIKIAKGQATVVPGSGNARLKVRFEGLASLVPVPAEGNYWILALTPDYRAALIGTPDRKFLWLLARTSTLDSITIERLLKVGGDAHFPVGLMQFDKHPASATAPRNSTHGIANSE